MRKSGSNRGYQNRLSHFEARLERGTLRNAPRKLDFNWAAWPSRSPEDVAAKLLCARQSVRRVLDDLEDRLTAYQSSEKCSRSPESAVPQADAAPRVFPSTDTSGTGVSWRSPGTLGLSHRLPSVADSTSPCTSANSTDAFRMLCRARSHRRYLDYARGTPMHRATPRYARRTEVASRCVNVSALDPRIPV